MLVTDLDASCAKGLMAIGELCLSAIQSCRCWSHLRRRRGVSFSARLLASHWRGREGFDGIDSRHRLVILDVSFDSDLIQPKTLYLLCMKVDQPYKMTHRHRKRLVAPRIRILEGKRTWSVLAGAEQFWRQAPGQMESLGLETLIGWAALTGAHQRATPGPCR